MYSYELQKLSIEMTSCEKEVFKWIYKNRSVQFKDLQNQVNSNPKNLAYNLNSQKLDLIVQKLMGYGLIKIKPAILNEFKMILITATSFQFIQYFKK